MISGKIDRLVDLMAKLEDAVPGDSDIRNHPTYQRLRGHRKINHFNVATSALPARIVQRLGLLPRLHLGER